MKKKGLIISSAVIIALIGGTITWAHDSSVHDDNIADELIANKLVKHDLENSISFTGAVKGDVVSVGNVQNSVCKEVKVSDGDYVNAGDTLFVFDDTDLQKEYDKTLEKYNAEREKASLSSSANKKSLQMVIDEENSSLAQAQAKINYAERTLNDSLSKKDQLIIDRDSLTNQKEELRQQITSDDVSDTQKSLLSTDYADISERLQNVILKITTIEDSIPELERNVAIAKENYDNVKAEYESKKAVEQNKIDSEKTQVFEIEQTDLDKIKNKIESCIVKAPASGIISDISVCKGSVANGSVLANIHNNSNCHIEASIAENKIVKLKTGMDVKIKTATTGDEEVDGVIRSISRYGNNNENVVNYSLDIDLIDETKSSELMMNMTANIRIVQDTVKDTYAVPYDAVLNEDGQDYILTAEPLKDHYILKRVYVEKGVNSNYLCEISGEELKDDMLVVIMPKDCDENDEVNIDIE